MDTNRIRLTALLVTFFTGFTGLVYEVTWHRYLSNFVGSQAQATALILAVFLGGLCVGYGLFGYLCNGRSARSVVKITGWIEVIIGVWAVFFPSIYQGVWELSGIINPESSYAFVLELGVCVLLIGLPTICMGGTLPLLTQGLSKDLVDAAPFHAKVYAINTAGAFLGCLVAGFMLLPNLGLPLTMMCIGPVNLIAGVILLLLGALLSDIPIEETPTQRASTYSPGSVAILPAIIVATLAGTYSITLQTVFIRLVGISMGSSEYAFSMVVAVFVLMLAIGAWFFAGNEKKRGFPLWINQVILVVGAMFVYFSVPHWPYASHVLRSLLTSVPPNFYVYHLMMFLVLTLVLALPVGAMGGTMPLLFSEVRRGMARLGSMVGLLYAWNTLGCVMGAIVGGYLLLYYLDLDAIFRLCIAGSALTVALVYPWKKRGVSVALAGGASLMIFAPMILVNWDSTRLGMGLFRLREANKLTFVGAEKFYKDYFLYAQQLSYEDGPNTSVSVIEFSGIPGQSGDHGVNYSRSLYVNGKSDGKTSGNDLGTGRLSGHLPALLSEFDTPDAAVVGFGTGVTLSSLSLYEELDSISCIEISPVVRDAAPYFDFATRGVSKDPKISWKIGDGYRILGTSKKNYSVIVSVPSNPWVVGVERLYSREFYEIVHSRLSEGGVYAQWFQIYDASPQVVSLVVNTFSRVFPHVRFFANRYDMIMLGAKRPLDENRLQRLQERVSRKAIGRELREIGVFNPGDVLSLERWISPQVFSGAAEHTLEYPKLAFTAGKEFFFGNPAGINRYLERVTNRPLMRATAESSLLNISQGEEYWSSDQLKSFASFHCAMKRERLHLPKNFNAKSKACRTSLAALALRGEIEPNSHLSREDLELLNEVLQGQPPEGGFDTVSRGIELFEKYDSIFIPIASSQIESFASHCFGVNTKYAFSCRLALLEALALTGHKSEAQGHLRALVNDERLTPRMEFYLRSLIGGEHTKVASAGR